MTLRCSHVARSAAAFATLVVFDTAVPHSASAQVADSAAADSAAMMAQFDMMGPMMGRMMSSMLNATLEVLAQPATAERMATFTRNYFDALLGKGFTREEALRIVLAHGVPMPGQQ